MDVWPLRARLCARPEISPESNSVQTLQKSFGWDYKPRSLACIYAYMHAKRSEMHVKDHVVMSGFGGLWKHQINPACTKKCQSLHKSLYKLASKLQLVPKYPNCHKRFLVSQTTYVLTLRCYFSCTRTAEVTAEGHVQLMFGQQVGVREIRIETTKRTKLSNALWLNIQIKLQGTEPVCVCLCVCVCVCQCVCVRACVWILVYTSLRASCS